MVLSAAYVVDFDGTVTDRDITSELAAHFGGGAYMEIEKSYRRREIPIRIWLKLIAELLPPDMDLLREKSMQWAEIRPGFGCLLDHARQQGSPVLIASDGLGFYIEPILEKYGFLHRVKGIYRNDTLLETGKKLSVLNPHAHPSCNICGNCKAAHVLQLKEEGRPVIYVGDGSNDRFGASWGDHVCARDRLEEACLEFDFPYSSWIDFYDIIKVKPPSLTDRSQGSLCLPRGAGLKRG